MILQQRMSRALLDPKYVEKVGSSRGPQLPKRNHRSQMDPSWSCCDKDDGFENNDSFGYVLPDVMSSCSSRGKKIIILKK